MLAWFNYIKKDLGLFIVVHLPLPQKERIEVGVSPSFTQHLTVIIRNKGNYLCYTK